MLDKLEIGYITSTHGLKGEVNVYPTTDEPERFEYLENVLTELNGRSSSLEVERVSFFKGRPIVKFRGVDSIEDAQKLRGSTLLVRREDAIPLEEGEYFIGDLIGSRVLAEDGTFYGMLKNILRTGANDVYEIEKEEGGLSYVAAVPDFVLDIDAEGQVIRIRVPKEL